MIYEAFSRHILTMSEKIDRFRSKYRKFSSNTAKLRFEIGEGMAAHNMLIRVVFKLMRKT